MAAQLRDRRELQHDLQSAVANDELRLDFQPLARIDGEIVGFEALVRWHHPSRGLVAPGIFVPLTEESGLIVAMGEWILRAACREAASWPNQLQISVNLVAGAVSQRRHRAACPRDSDRDRIGRRAARARDHGRRSDRRLLSRGVDPAAPQIARRAHRARRFRHRLLVDVLSAGVPVRHDQDRPQLHIEPRTQRAIEGAIAWRHRTGARARASGDRRGRRDASPARCSHPCRLRSRAGLPDRKAGVDRRLCRGRGPAGQPGSNAASGPARRRRRGVRDEYCEGEPKIPTRRWSDALEIDPDRNRAVPRRPCGDR